MKKRRIKRVGVIGSGVMGSQIACLLANSRIPVLLLDIVPSQLTDAERKKGLTLNDAMVRNRIARENLERALQLSPPPIADIALKDLITVGNIEDHLSTLRECDWIIEAVVEDINIKKDLFRKLNEAVKDTDVIISSNTSSISLNALSEAFDPGVRPRFLGTHFFNPPRYLPLLEVIPARETSGEVVSFISDFCRKFLGREVVIAKDSPGFIANRIAVYSMLVVFNALRKWNLKPSQVDELLGEVTGRPKSAIFRTADIVGIDTLFRVIKVLKENLPEDQALQKEEVPSFLNDMISKGLLGEKTRKGFYEKRKEKGRSVIYELDPQTMEYEPARYLNDMQLEVIKRESSLTERIKRLWAMEGKYGDFYRYVNAATILYAWKVFPEVATEIWAVDRALQAGFGWKMGPFQLIDMIGKDNVIAVAREHGIHVEESILKVDHFYREDERGRTLFLDIEKGEYSILPEEKDPYNINVLRKSRKIWSNEKATFFHIDDEAGVFLIHTRGNTLDDTVGRALKQALNESIEKFSGLVIAGAGEHFCMGANLALIYSLASSGDYDELELIIHNFQQLNMEIKYAPVPAVAILQGYVLGGGCEIAMHTSCNVAFIDTYMGLVEAGMGLLPAGGGIKELLLRFSSIADQEGTVPELLLMEFIKKVVTAHVARSAYEAAKDMFLTPHHHIVFSRKELLACAVNVIRTMNAGGYTPPLKRKVKLLGKDAMGVAYAAIDSYFRGGRITEFEKKLAEKIAAVFCGGEDLSEPAWVSEQYILDRERETFLSLVSDPKTLDRISSFLKTGKVIRN